MNIITLTLNPAIDIHCYVKDFKPFCENSASVISSDIGGKGINVSRALTVVGTENIAYVVLGVENKEVFIKGLNAAKINYKFLSAGGRIRENYTLHTDNSPETRISFSDFYVNKNTLTIIENMLYEEELEDSVVVLGGSLPDGIDVCAVKELLKRVKARGAKIVIDSRSFKKEDIMDVKPWLIKPNEEEIAMYSDIEIKNLETGKKAAMELKEQGVENVMISLGRKGAILCCDEGIYYAPAPDIKVVSTIGAGDSAIAGFVSGIVKGCGFREALRYAVAYGSAACMEKGTRPPRKEIIEKMIDNINIFD